MTVTEVHLCICPGVNSWFCLLELTLCGLVQNSMHSEKTTTKWGEKKSTSCLTPKWATRARDEKGSVPVTLCARVWHRLHAMSPTAVDGAKMRTEEEGDRFFYTGRWLSETGVNETVTKFLQASAVFSVGGACRQRKTRSLIILVTCCLFNLLNTSVSHQTNLIISSFFI